MQSDLIEKQRADNSDIALWFQKALTEEEAILQLECFYLKCDILMRKDIVPADEEGAEQHQIVVPESYRPAILSRAHDAPLSGHLSVNKTYLKILKQFYWPNLKNDVAQFCWSCLTCQMVPNQTIPDTDLEPKPDFEEPVSSVLPGYAGLRSVSEWLLTIVHELIRFPEKLSCKDVHTLTQFTENLLHDDSHTLSMNLVQYVTNIQEILQKVCDVTKMNIGSVHSILLEILIQTDAKNISTPVQFSDVDTSEREDLKNYSKKPEDPHEEVQDLYLMNNNFMKPSKINWNERIT